MCAQTAQPQQDLFSALIADMQQGKDDILKAFGEFTLPRLNLPGVKESVINTLWQFEQEYNEVYAFYENLRQQVVKKSEQYKDKTDSRDRELFMGSNVFSQFNKQMLVDIWDLNTAFINAIFAAMTEDTPDEWTRIKKDVYSTLLGDSSQRYRGQYDPVPITVQTCYELLMKELGGKTLVEQANEKLLEQFQDDTHETRYNFATRSRVRGESLLSRTDALVIWRSRHTHGNNDTYFSGEYGLKPFFTVLSKFETGNLELAPWWEKICKRGECRQCFTAAMPITDSKMVDSVTFYKKGKVEIKFTDWETANRFMEFCESI